MNDKGLQSAMARRLFLARLGVGAGVVGASAVSSSAAAAQLAPDAPWHPTRHAQDDWLEKIPGQHRFVFDTHTPDGMALALQFAGNYFTTNQDAYGLKGSDLAVVIVARHKSTSFGYNNAMWAKYGKQFSEHSGFTDPKTKEPPTVNVYLTAGNDAAQAGRMDALIKMGVHLAVCRTASRGIAGNIARAVGADPDKILEEMAANLADNAHLVPAGIVAVNRAQERGYSFVSAI